jgi:hypothetical protein
MQQALRHVALDGAGTTALKEMLYGASAGAMD